MKDALEMMKEILKETCQQIEDNLPSGEYLISYITVYDKRNAVSTNIFLTNQAIFLQESSEQEKLKKRRFDKISDIKLTHTELYIEFINGYVLVGDVADRYAEAEKFFNDIKANTKIKMSSVSDLNSQMTTEDLAEQRNAHRFNQFLGGRTAPKKAQQETSTESSEPVKSLINDYVDEKEKEKQEINSKKNNKKILIIAAIAVVVIAIIAGISAFAISASNKKKEAEAFAAKVSATKARDEELFQYSIAANTFHGYIVDLLADYDEISITQGTINLAPYEETLRNMQKEFEEKYGNEFRATSAAYITYDVAKIDEWMNKIRQMVLDTFDLFSDNLDGSFQSSIKMLQLKSALDEADGEIRKTQTIIEEENQEIKKAYATLTGTEYVPESTPVDDDVDENVDTSENIPTNTEQNEQANDNPYADDEGFVDESDKNKVSTTQTEEQAPGREDQESYIGE